MKRTRRSPAKSSSASTSTGRKRRKTPGRNTIVLASLMGALILTSGLLLVLSPAPLAPNAQSLMAADVTDGLEPLFRTAASIERGRWRRVYIHHTRSRRGNVYDGAAPGDHILIGNGDGAFDGEIQAGVRWDQQQQASVSGSTITDDCITVALVGDFNIKAPTAAQLKSLERLLTALNRELEIPWEAIVIDERQADAKGVGRHFPIATLRAFGR